MTGAPTLHEAMNKMDQIVLRLQELQSMVLSAQCESNKTMAEGDWWQWSEPAEMLHRAVLDIQLVARQIVTGEDVARGDPIKQKQGGSFIKSEPKFFKLAAAKAPVKNKAKFSKQQQLTTKVKNLLQIKVDDKFPNLPPQSFNRRSSKISLPLLIDKLPSKQKPSVSTPLVLTSQRLPYPPSHFSRRNR